MDTFPALVFGGAETAKRAACQGPDGAEPRGGGGGHLRLPP